MRRSTVLICWGLWIMAGQVASGQEPNTLMGHTDPAYAAVYLKDGSRLVTAAFDKTLKLWDLPSRTCLKTMQGHTGLVLCLSLSPDQRQLISGSLDNTVRVWDIPQAGPTGEWQRHPQATVFDISTDGSWMLTSGSDRTLKLWNTADDQLVREFDQQSPNVVRVAIRPDKQQIAVADAAGYVRFYNPNDGTLQGTVGAHPGEITGLAYPPNNAFVLTSGADGWVRRWPNQLPAVRRARGHTGPITALKLSPNNAYFVTASTDQSVRLWGYGDASEQRKLEGQTAAITALAISSDGNRILTGGGDKIPRWYDAGNAQLIKSFPEQSSAIVALAVHPNGQEIAVADGSGAIKIYGTNEANEIRTLAGHAGGTLTLQYAPNQQWLVSAGADKIVRVWNNADGNEVRKIDLPEVCRAIAISPDSQVLALGSDDQLTRLISFGDGSLQHTFPAVGDVIAGVEIARDNQHLAITSKAGSITVWNIPQKRLVQQFATLPGTTVPAAWGGDHKTLVFAGGDHQVLVDSLSLQMSHQADEQRVNSLAVHPNSGWHATAGQDGQVKLWDSGGGGAIRQFLGHQGPVKSVAIRPDQQQLASGGSDQRLILWNINDPSRPQYDIKTPAEVSQIKYSPDSKKLIAAGSDHLLRSFDPTPPNPPPAQPPSQEPAQVTNGHTATITGLGWSADNITAYSAAMDGWSRRWNIAAIGATAVLQGHQSQVYAVAWDPTGKWIASASNDKTVKIWDAATKQNVRTFAAQAGAVYGLCFTPDGQQIITAGGDKTVRVYKTDDGAELKQLSGATDAVYTITISPDGTKVAAAGLNRQIFLWDLASGQLVRTLAGHPDDIYRVDFNPTGTRLVSVGYAGNLRIWDPNQDQPLHSQKLPYVAYSVVYSPNGQQLAVTGNDSQIHLLDVPPQAR